jgi:pimeloyl-ACP methyl ester carboxylesterase
MATNNTHIALAAVVTAAALGGVAVACTTAAGSTVSPSRQVRASALSAAASAPARVRTWTIRYTAHNGLRPKAYVILPASYGPGHANPPLPLVIAPHGRGVTGKTNAGYWGSLPGLGRFAVVNPDGYGRRLQRYSWGYPKQIDDLARMPQVVTRALPWLRIDRSRIYALGSSMGGQETLLLAGRYPHLLAGAVAMDSVTDMALRYAHLPQTACNRRCLQRLGEPMGRALQRQMRAEIGGSPAEASEAYAARSPITYLQRLASSGVPVQVWWSSRDKIVTDQRDQSAAFAQAVRRINACAPLTTVKGTWRHSHEMRSTELLPVALAKLGLLPTAYDDLPSGVQYGAPASGCGIA